MLSKHIQAIHLTRTDHGWHYEVSVKGAAARNITPCVSPEAALRAAQQHADLLREEQEAA